MKAERAALIGMGARGLGSLCSRRWRQGSALAQTAPLHILFNVGEVQSLCSVPKWRRESGENKRVRVKSSLEFLRKRAVAPSRDCAQRRNHTWFLVWGDQMWKKEWMAL